MSMSTSCGPGWRRSIANAASGAPAALAAHAGVRSFCSFSARAGVPAEWEGFFGMLSLPPGVLPSGEAPGSGPDARLAHSARSPPPAPPVAKCSRLPLPSSTPPPGRYLVPMPPAILGPGGVGGFVGAVLAGAGEQVTLLLRPETYAVHPDTLSLESPLGNITAPCRRAAALEEDVDVLWVATKATQLEAALGAVPVPRRARMVVPLLNGVDHVARLRSRFDARRVVPGTIAAELERTSPGRIVLRSPFARFGFAAAGRDVLAPVAAILTRFGCATAFESDELTLLWRKLVLLAPMALTTTASGMAVGEL